MSENGTLAHKPATTREVFEAAEHQLTEALPVEKHFAEESYLFAIGRLPESLLDIVLNDVAAFEIAYDALKQRGVSRHWREGWRRFLGLSRGERGTLP